MQNVAGNVCGRGGGCNRAGIELLIVGDDIPDGWGDPWMADGAKLTLKREESVAKTGSASLGLRIDSGPETMAWAEGEWPRVQAGITDGTIKPEARQMHDMPAARSLAALELYRLTGNDAWHELLLTTTRLTDPAAPLSKWQEHDDRAAAVAYVLRKQSDEPIDPVHICDPSRI